MSPVVVAVTTELIVPARWRNVAAGIRGLVFLLIEMVVFLRDPDSCGLRFPRAIPASALSAERPVGLSPLCACSCPMVGNGFVLFFMSVQGDGEADGRCLCNFSARCMRGKSDNRKHLIN